MATVMRLRLLIPAAIAAFATYTLLVRGRETDGLGLETDGWDPLQPYRETPPSSRTSTPVVTPEPDALVSTQETPTSESPTELAAEMPRRSADAEFLDMFPRAEGTGPSVYDYLAGDPPATPAFREPVGEETPPVSETVETSEQTAQAAEPSSSLEPPPPSEVVADVSAEDDVVHPPAAETSSWSPRPDETPTRPPVAAHGVGMPLDEGRFALGGWAAASGHSTVSSVTFRRRLAAPVRADQIEISVDAAENVPDGGITVLSDPGFAPDREGFTLLLAAADPGSFSAAGSYRVMPDPAA